MTAITTAAITTITADDVVKSLYAIQDQDDANRDGAMRATYLRVNFAITVHRAITSKVTNASKLAKLIEAERAVRDLSDDVASFGSNQMIGYYATAGELLLLPGELPEGTTVTRIAMDIKEVSHAAARKVIRRPEMDIPTAVGILRSMAAEIIDARKEVKVKTPAQLLKAATGPVGKAVELTDEWDEEAIALAQALFASLGAALTHISAPDAEPLKIVA